MGTFTAAVPMLVVVHLGLVFLLKVLCVIVGFLIVQIGSDLLRRGISGEFKFVGSMAGGKADLRSASPGLLFLLLGALLIGYAMWVTKISEVTVSTAGTSGVPAVPLPKEEPPRSQSR